MYTPQVLTCTLELPRWQRNGNLWCLRVSLDSKHSRPRSRHARCLQSQSYRLQPLFRAVNSIHEHSKHIQNLREDRWSARGAKKDIICKRADWLGKQHPDVAPVGPAHGSCRNNGFESIRTTFSRTAYDCDCSDWL